LTLLAVAIGGGVFEAGAAVTPYGWWRGGEANTAFLSYMYDSTTNNFHMFGSFENSAIYPGNSAAVTNIAAGGPLGPNRIFSSQSAKQHMAAPNNGGYYSLNLTNLPGPLYGAPRVAWDIKTNKNWIMECWFLPAGSGIEKGDRDQACLLEMAGNNFTGVCTNWGPQFWLVASNDVAGTHWDGTVELQCFMMGPDSANVCHVTTNSAGVSINSSYPAGIPWYRDTNGLSWSFQLGTNVVIQTPNRKKWTHMAVVRDNTAALPPQCPAFYPGEVGTVTLYVDGVACGVTNASRCYQPGILKAPYDVLPVEFTDRPSMGTDNASTKNIGNYPTDPTAPGFAFPPNSGGIGGAGNRQCNGWLDEVRISTFTDGAFTLSDLLLRSVPGPGIVQQPSDVTVYSGNAAPFQVIAAYDDANTYQWWKVTGGTTNAITTAGVVTTNQQLILPSTAYVSGDKFVCQLSNPSGRVFTTTNTVTTVSNPTANVIAYQAAVVGESSLISYFPGDTDDPTGTTWHDIHGGNHGTLSGNVAFDGSTNRFASGQGLTFNRQGRWDNPTNQYTRGDDVTIPANAAYDFAGGFGTVEAVIHMDPEAGTEPFAMNYPQSLYGFSWLAAADMTVGTTISQSGYGNPDNGGAARYIFSADPRGHLIYWAPADPTVVQFGNPGQKNDMQMIPLIWNVPGGTVNRTLHVAFAFDNNTNITCYVNGQNLGTRQNIGTNAIFGFNGGYPLHVGNGSYTPMVLFSDGNTIFHSEGFIPALWYGSVDELALYSSALPDSTIAAHAYKYFNGSSATAASVTMLTPSKSMFAHAAQTITVKAGGEPPWTYTWKTNSVVVAGAGLPSLSLSNITATVSVTCTVQGGSGGPAVSAPCVITITTPTAGSYADQVMATAPSAFYRFNETGGTAAYDWAGTHDGTYSGGYSKNESGPALGEGGVHIYGTNLLAGTLSQVTVPWAPELFALAPGNTNGQFSYEYWFKPDPTTNGFIQATLSGQFRLGNNRAGIENVYDNAKNFGNASFGEYWGRSGRYNNINQASAWGANTSAYEATNVWHHIVQTYVPNGTGSPYTGLHGIMNFYVDGALISSGGSDFNPYTVNAGQWQPNYHADLIIGNTALNNPSLSFTPARGVIGDVAIYNTALTALQVSNHYSAFYTPSTSVSLTPATAATNESVTSTITLSCLADGHGNAYYWQKNGVPISESYNPDGTPHYPRLNNGLFDVQGVPTPVLLIAQPTPADNGTYSCVVSNRLNSGGVLSPNTATAVVTVTADTTLPAAINATALGTQVSGFVADQLLTTGGINSTPGTPSLLQVRFDKRMDVTAATTASHYTIAGPGSPVVGLVHIANNQVNDTMFGSDFRTVTLETGGLTPGGSYTLTVSGVKDQTYTGNVMAAKTLRFTAPTLTSGACLWDYYYPINGSLGSQQANTNSAFPFVPQVSLRLPGMTEEGILAGAGRLSNVGPWNTGAAGTSYFQSLTAWVTPTNTGWYQLFLTGNDNVATLWMNTSGGAPSGAGLMGTCIGGGSVFTSGDVLTSVLLTNGVSYFIQAQGLVTGGSDRLQVGWLYTGLTGANTALDGAWGGGGLTAATGPIGPEFLSTYGSGAALVTGPSFHPAVASGGGITLSWDGYGELLQSADVSLPLSQWQSLGHQNSPFVVTPVPGAPQKFFQLRQ